MPIFLEEQGGYKKLKVAPLDKERTLQQLIEHNLFEILEMRLLASEYSTTFGGRIDTLAVDANNAPVIIEYKLNKNENVINQGLSYLLWLKAQKVEFFEMLIIKKLGKEVLEKAIDWANPRVICIAESYSKYDLDTVQVIPLRLELYKYRLYEKGIFSLEPLNTKDKQDEKDKTEKISLVETTTDDTALKNSSPQIDELTKEFRSRVMQMDEEIFEKKTSYYIGYSVLKNFAEVYVGKKAIKIHLRPIDYDDPLNMIEKVSESYNWTLDRRVYLKEMSELDYVMKLVEQSYKDVI